MNSYFSTAYNTYIQSYSGLSRSVWKGIFLSFVDATLGGVFYFLSIYFANMLHIDVKIVGFIIGFYGVGAIFGGFAGGRFSDKFSPRVVQIISLLFQAIGYLALIKLRSIPWLIADTFVLGFSTYAFITANYLFVLSMIDSEEKVKLRAINLLSMSSNLGLALSAVLVGFFALYGFKYIFFVTGIAFSVLLLYLMLSEKEKNITIPGGNSKPSTLGITANSILLIVLCCVFFTGMGVAQISSTYSIYLHHLFPAMGFQSASILFTLNSILVVLFEAPLVSLFSEKNKIVMVGVGALLIGVGLMLLSFSIVFGLAILSCVIYTVGEMIFFSMAQFICYQKSSPNKKGKGMGLYRMVYASSRVVGPAVGSIIYTQLGGHFVWYFCGIVGAICMTICWGAKNIYTDVSTVC